MAPKIQLVWILAFWFFPASIRAQDPHDADSFCAYQMEQAEAQRDLLRTPVAAGGLTQPETGLPTQVVGGASLGVSNVKKAAITMEVARSNCDLYRSTTGVQQQLQYATPMLEREALRNRLTLIDRASAELQALMDSTGKMLKEQNATRLMVFTLETTRTKLEADRTDTQSKIAAIYVPDLNVTPIKEMVTRKQGDEVAEQQAQDHLNRQNNWDLALQVGVHQQVNPAAQGPQPYGSFSFNYNFASRSIDRHLDNAVTAYANWKQAQEGDVIRNMDVLHQELTATIEADESRQQSLQSQLKELDSDHQVVAEPDTSAALDFRNQIDAARILLQIELDDTAFRLSHLKDYCARNF
ncbi:MAG: hypothetical protein WBP85_05820 [Terracidiphilus sp.]